MYQRSPAASFKHAENRRRGFLEIVFSCEIRRGVNNSVCVWLVNSGFLVVRFQPRNIGARCALCEIYTDVLWRHRRQHPAKCRTSKVLFTTASVMEFCEICGGVCDCFRSRSWRN